MPFTVHRTAAATTPPDVREYDRFTDVIDDTIDARIYLGIHFRAPDVRGADIGQNDAHWLDKHTPPAGEVELTALRRSRRQLRPPRFNRGVVPERGQACAYATLRRTRARLLRVTGLARVGSVRSSIGKRILQNVQDEP